MIKSIAIAGIAMFIAFAMAYEATGLSGVRRRGSAYFICFLCVFAGSVLFGLIMGSGASPGDEDSLGRVAVEYVPPMPRARRDEIIENLFLITIVPALLGVRLALGKPDRKTK